VRLTIDTDGETLEIAEGVHSRTVPLYSREAFEIISHEWVRVGWNEKYPYTFSWMGRPVIQLPEDMIRIQEVIYQVRPDVILETGVAHGGSLVFYASLCKAMEKGRVIGIDIEIRPRNRAAIEAHELKPYITLIEGSSTDPATVEQARSLIASGESVLVILDSCHTKEHVAQELAAYADFVAPGSYIVATDGVMRDVADVPRGTESWSWDNPIEAAIEFAATHPEFVLEKPEWPFNESELTEPVTHWPCAWLRKRG
jgi:cephalosporin hydroxylase